MTKPVLPPSRFGALTQCQGSEIPTILTAAAARTRLVGQLAALVPPRIVGSADGQDIRELREHFAGVAALFDEYSAAIGAIVQSHTPHGVDLDLFDRPFLTAIEGNALHQMDVTADELDEDNGQFGVGA